MVIDVVTFNGEKELFELRYNILKDYVDSFRVIEFDQTFSGKPKKPLFDQYFNKVRHYIHTDWDKYYQMALESPNCPKDGPEHWRREFCQKESIKDALSDLNDKDIVFIGDVDEIWNPELMKDFVYADTPLKLKLKVYSYFLNNRSNEEFWGTLMARYGDVKNECLNHLRSNTDFRTKQDYGWHFTSMGGYERVKEKLTDSYTNDSYANDWVLNNLESNINENSDFLGRQFNYINSEEEWPPYLRDNRGSYSHLLRP